MNGQEALLHLKADTRTAHIPVVAISAHTLDEAVARGLDAGFSAYVTKPVDLTQLRALLDELLPTPHASAG
jgi:protein-histidine pros-kinase